MGVSEDEKCKNNEFKEPLLSQSKSDFLISSSSSINSSSQTCSPSTNSSLSSSISTSTTSHFSNYSLPKLQVDFRTDNTATCNKDNKLNNVNINLKHSSTDSLNNSLNQNTQFNSSSIQNLFDAGLNSKLILRSKSEQVNSSKTNQAKTGNELDENKTNCDNKEYFFLMNSNNFCELQNLQPSKSISQSNLTNFIVSNKKKKLNDDNVLNDENSFIKSNLSTPNFNFGKNHNLINRSINSDDFKDKCYNNWVLNNISTNDNINANFNIIKTNLTNLNKDFQIENCNKQFTLNENENQINLNNNNLNSKSKNSNILSVAAAGPSGLQKLDTTNQNISTIKLNNKFNNSLNSEFENHNQVFAYNFDSDEDANNLDFDFNDNNLDLSIKTDANSQGSQNLIFSKLDSVSNEYCPANLDPHFQQLTPTSLLENVENFNSSHNLINLNANNFQNASATNSSKIYSNEEHESTVSSNGSKSKKSILLPQLHNEHCQKFKNNKNSSRCCSSGNTLNLNTNRNNCSINNSIGKNFHLISNQNNSLASNKNETLNGSLSQLSVASSLITDPFLPICKICHLNANKNDKLISPCKCAGTMKFIHCSCLMKWLEISRKKSRKPLTCELCQYHYQWHKKFKVNHWKFPTCSKKDKILHLVFLMSVMIMLVCAVITIMCFKQEKYVRISGIPHSQLSDTEMITLICGVMFFLSFFMSMYVEVKAHNTLYRLIMEFINMNQEWYIDEYEKKENLDGPVHV